MAGITLTIEVDDKGSVKVKQFADETKKAFDEMQRGPRAAQGPLNNLREGWVGLTAKLTAATGAIYGVTRAFSSFVAEAAQAEEIENRLRYTLETTGYTWQYAKTAVDEFASSIQKTTRFSDEQARQALTDMMMYTNDFAKAQMGAKLAMDMSIRTGQDLHSTTRLIGMAMSGNVEMLGRYIPELRNLEARLGENATMAQKAEYAMKVLNEKFGGTAQAEIGTYAHTVAQFNNAWSDLKETLGRWVLPVVKDVLIEFKKLADVINTLAGKKPDETVIARLKNDLKDAEMQIRIYTMAIERAEKAAPGSPWRLGPEAMQKAKEQKAEWEAWAKYLREQIEKDEASIKARIVAETRKDVFLDLKKEAEKIDPRTIVDQVRGAISQVIREYEALGIAALKANEKMIEGWYEKGLPDIVDQVQAEISQVINEYEALGAEALKANQAMIDAFSVPTADEILEEINKVIAAEEALGQAAINRMELQESTWRMAKSNVSEFQTLWDGAIKSIGDSFQAGFFDLFKGGIKNLSDWWKGFVNNMVQSFSRAIAQMISNWIVFGNITGQTREKGGGWGGILGLVTSVIKLFGEGGIVSGWKPIKTFQHGGVVDRPTLGLIGEAGQPEAVVPLKQGKIPVEMQGQRGTTNLFYIQAIDPISFRDFIRRNPEAIIEVTQRDARSAGPMSSMPTR